jgi:serine/alanine adding enzyme
MIDSPRTIEVRVHQGPGLAEIRPEIESFDRASAPGHLSQRPMMMLGVLEQGLRHAPYILAASAHGRLVGYLALAHVRSLIFGRFLVSLPYVNTAGVVAEDGEVASRLIDRSVQLADELGVRYLELRHERPIEHPALGETMTSKVHMRLDLPKKVDQLWDRLHSKVRNQVRKGWKNGLSIDWGREESLPDFYRVFSENMRDLGTPVYSPRLFASLLHQSDGRAEICIARDGGRVLAAAFLLHGHGVTEVPSASSLRRYNHANANMFMYWHLLVRAIERGQDAFDFGRSSVGGNTYRFKQQWGAVEAPSAWQYYLRDRTSKPMRPENQGFRTLARAWRRLPLCVANAVGPAIVRGIP